MWRLKDDRSISTRVGHSDCATLHLWNFAVSACSDSVHCACVHGEARGPSCLYLGEGGGLHGVGAVTCNSWEQWRTQDFSKGGGGATLHARCCVRPEKADECQGGGGGGGGGSVTLFFPSSNFLGKFSRHGVGVSNYPSYIVHHWSMPLHKLVPLK